MTKSLRANWHNVQVTDNLKTEGLVAIEECTDYDFDIVKSSEGPKRKLFDSKLGKSKKQKLSKSQTSPENDLFSPSKTGSSSTNVSVTEFEPKECTDLAWTPYGLPSELIRALKEQNFHQPTEIQALTLPAAILGRRDILGAAETGSGKTLAFGLPILTGIWHKKRETTSEKPLFALILTPTRELAMQIRGHLVAAAKYLNIDVAVLVGGMAAVKQERILAKGPEIVVATPGRLWELLQAGNAHLAKIEALSYLVIDETDRMLERGHFEELQELLDALKQGPTHGKRQNFVFSATLTLIHDLPKYLVARRRRKARQMTPEGKLQRIVDALGMRQPKVVDISKGGGTAEALTESRITCQIDEKDYYVYYFLQKHPGRTLIFCNSIGCVRRLANLLGALQCRPLPLHASMQQRQRLKNLERFRDDEFAVLVATDVAARGLDIPKVEHVLHYQTPRTSESYVHRSGRTARASRQGITVLLIEPGEIQNYIKLCKTLNKSEDLPIFPVEEGYLNAVKERVKLARELDKLELDVRKGNSEAGWFQKAAEEMDIIIDDFHKRFDQDEISKEKKVAEIKRKQLANLLTKPVFPKGFSGKYLSDEVSAAFLQGEQKTAVEVMKNAIDLAAKDKSKKNIPLFKRNKLRRTNINNDQNRKISLKVKDNKKNKKSSKNRRRK